MTKYNNDVALPTHSLATVIEIANAYLDAAGVRLEGRFLLEARWHKHPTNKQWCWLLQWMNESQLNSLHRKPQIRGGGHLSVQVFDDGQVSHSFAR